MRNGLVIVALALALLGTARASAEPARSTSVAPFAAMRTLQILQEQIAHGNGTAQAAQPNLMAHIADRFLATDPEVWREPRNARAAVLFLLSGGKPAVIRTILAKSALPHDFDRLVKGALAYGDGDDATARELLGSIDPRTLPSSLGGHLALVQATLLSDQDNAKASRLLDLARLLVPGTLVEEAALRRQVYLLASPETFPKFVFLSREYIRRFRNSIYADNFKQRLTSVATKLAMAGDVASLSKFDAILGELPVKEQLGFDLMIAKVAIVQGKAAAARFAAEKAAALAAVQSPDGARSKLYVAAALIVSEDSGQGVKTLESIDRSRLSPDDAELRDAAMAVATSVRSEVPEARGDTGGGLPAALLADSPGSATIEQARNALASTDKLLQDVQP